MTNKKNPIRFIPLGGFGEIGMNCLAVHADRQILIIDCGVLFPVEPRLGIETIHASFTYLTQHADEVVGLVATHGHEDHIAAIPFLLQEISIPIYAGSYTNGLLRARLLEYENIKKPELINIFPEVRINIGDFIITPLQMPHSTEDNFALTIEWRQQRIFHTSDFKLNRFSSEQASIVQRLTEVGPVDIMITDSTGALVSNDAGDEHTLIESIGGLVQNADGRVFIALFSSNVQRIRTFLQIARNTGRKLVMSGKSVINHYTIARETNIIPSTDAAIIPARKANQFKENELLILMSGTQGESRSALGRYAAGLHAQFTPSNTDTVILSSRFIPGNELQISQTISRLMEQNVTVYHSNNREDIHVSGHGSKNEIRDAMKAVNPKALLPAHGTYEHLQATAEIAREAGIKNILVAVNGDVITLTQGSLSITDKVDTGRIFIENSRPVPEEVLKARRKIGNCGVLALWITIRSDGNSVFNADVRAQSLGVIPQDALDEARDKLKKIVKDTLSESSPKHPNLEQQIKITVRRYLRQTFKRSPVFLIDIRRQD